MPRNSYNNHDPVSVAYGYALSQRGTVDGKTYQTAKVDTETVGNTITQYGYDKLGNIITQGDRVLVRGFSKTYKIVVEM